MTDDRLKKLEMLVRPKSCVGASIRFVDIAGLVRGAHQGEGLGNQFLGHIREADALIHVVRCFEHGEITHVDGSVDPVRDIETLETELLLADLAVLDRAVEHLERSSVRIRGQLKKLNWQPSKKPEKQSTRGSPCGRFL